MERVVSTQEAMDALHEVVQEAGEDYVYPMPGGTCLYVYENQPSCLIARVLHRLGVPLDVLARWELHSVRDMFSLSHLSDHKIRPNLILEKNAIDALFHAQQPQDLGVPWGKCEQRARDRLDALSRM